jgi:hypothetical protein
VELNYLFPVVGLDAAHMKDIIIYHNSKTHPRTLLEKMFVSVLSGRVVGNHTIILAFMLSYSESAENMNAFLDFVEECGIKMDKPGYTLISDRGSAILSSVTGRFHSMKHHFIQ